MAKIKDIIQLDLSEDIKDVIDLQDQSDEELKYEIDNYIITSKISKYLSDFINLYQGNTKETGVWISGFYGSGKSYFGKMLGYLLENRSVKGTPFRDRFNQRLTGLPNAGLIENAILGLEHHHSIVVFLDIAKQNTKNGFAWTLFKNFIRTLGFLDDVYGYMEYGLYLDGKYEQFVTDVKTKTGKDWKDIRKLPLKVPQIMKSVLTQTIWDDSTYDETKKYLDDRIKNYDASKFKEELSLYLETNPDKRIVFMIDEVSEAVGQEKIDLLQLEGISEALSTLPERSVWTVAIAQEKLDDVIHNASVSVQELNKVTDRFKHKFHLSSDEVDIVIRERLLSKNDSDNSKLQSYYTKHSGQITDSTDLNAKFSTKTKSAEDFSIYYPFHQYHFELLQNFLFAVHQRARTGGTERGMIIATHSVLKSAREMDTFNFITAETLVDGAKKVMDSELERKFAFSDKVLQEAKSDLNGTKMMKTVYLLNEAEKVPASADNVTKLYLSDLNDFYELKPKVEEALTFLCEGNLLLEKNGLYKITSDLEQKLIEEMTQHNVELHFRRRELVKRLQNLSFVSDLNSCYFENIPYQFQISTVQGDDIKSSPDKNISIKVASIYTVGADRDKYLEDIKFKTQSYGNLATLVPSMDKQTEIDNLIEEIYRYTVLEDRYQSDDDDKIRSIIQDFGITKQNRTNELERLLEKSYKNGTLICHFDENNLNNDAFTKAVQETHEKIIKNTYTDRLSSQLTEDVGLKIIKEKDGRKLKGLFTNKEFAFFDSDGAFIGEGLKVVEKINYLISNTYFDGSELENRLSAPPTNYAYGTIQTVCAVLMRSGRASMKFNGNQHFSYKDDEVISVFSKSRDFKKASFKAITSALSTRQKQELVDNLKELKAKKHLNIDFNYSTNDVELTDIIRQLSEHFIQNIRDEKQRNNEFDTYFFGVDEWLSELRNYAVKISGDNYKEKAENFLNGYANYKDAIDNIDSILSFIKEKLNKVEKFKSFIEHITTELKKLGAEYQHNKIFDLETDFGGKFNISVVEHYSALERLSQTVRDEYYSLMDAKHKEMTKQHTTLKQKSEDAIRKVKSVDESLNAGLIGQLNDIANYAENHCCDKLNIEFETECQKCHYSLNEIIASNQNIAIKTENVELLLTQIEYPKGSGDPQPKEVQLATVKGKYTANQYRSKLNEQLDKIKNLNDDDIVVVK